jgi:uncharacterized protein YbjQ (UPF0145 family)
MSALEAIVTFERVDGFQVVRRFGEVRGEATCQRNVLRSTFRTIGALIGIGPLDHLTDAERVRDECLSALLAEATRLGANGVVGLHFEAVEQADGATHVRAFGQAVLLDPAPGGSGA